MKKFFALAISLFLWSPNIFAQPGSFDTGLGQFGAGQKRKATAPAAPEAKKQKTAVAPSSSAAASVPKTGAPATPAPKQAPKIAASSLKVRHSFKDGHKCLPNAYGPLIAFNSKGFTPVFENDQGRRRNAVVKNIMKGLWFCNLPGWVEGGVFANREGRLPVITGDMARTGCAPYVAYYKRKTAEGFTQNIIAKRSGGKAYKQTPAYKMVRIIKEDCKNGTYARDYYREYVLLPFGRQKGSPAEEVTLAGKKYVVPASESNVGPERIIIGMFHEVYYTPDHYRTFIKLTAKH